MAAKKMLVDHEEPQVQEKEVEEIILQVWEKMTKKYIKDNFDLSEDQQEQLFNDFMHFIREKKEHYPTTTPPSLEGRQPTILRVPPPAMFEQYFIRFLLQHAPREFTFFGLCPYINTPFLTQEQISKLMQFYSKNKDKYSIAEKAYDSMMLSI